MGLSREAAYQSIRFSFSELNSAGEIRQAVQIIAAAYARMKAIFERHPDLTNARSVG
jgi:cysteine sulfinate desulfinase/cysteine desulfurase-like protein